MTYSSQHINDLGVLVDVMTMVTIGLGQMKLVFRQTVMLLLVVLHVQLYLLLATFQLTLIFLRWALLRILPRLILLPLLNLVRALLTTFEPNFF